MIKRNVMIKIIVEDKHIKDELIKESQYLHDQNIDIDECNTLSHLYLLPDECWIINNSSNKD